jgi:predicted dehydrogenase
MIPDSIPSNIQSALIHKLPPKIDYGIAFVGCGGIVNYGHIPSYKANGFHMIGGYDRNPEAAEKTVRTHGLKQIYSSLDELLSDPMVQIVDVAVVPEEQWNVVSKVIAAGKPLLCQKPFSIHYAKAVEMTTLANQADLKMAVHQQFRWSSIIQATQAIMAEGWLGDILDVQVQVSISTPWDMWPWIASQPRLEVLFHSIH